MRRMMGPALGVLLLASCDRLEGPADAPPAAAAFNHSISADLSGYYMPASETRVGKWSFGHIFVGQPQEFEAWEGGRSNEHLAPVLIQFDDTSSPMVADKFGRAVEHIVTIRVLPTAYSVSDTAINFQGRSPELGLVRFDGLLDPGALARPRRSLGDEGLLLTGRLTVGDSTAQNIQLRWWSGD